MISQQSIYSISEVAELTGFKPHVIRFYEKEFNLTIPREENNRRYFTDKEIQQLLHIKGLQNEGISNKQIKKILTSKKNGANKSDIKNDIAIANIRETSNTAKIEEYNDDIFIELKNEILMILEKHNYKNEINELKEKIEELKLELNAKEKDVLICENAKLKLKVKEKSYEVAELKDRLKRQEHQKTSIFQKILKTKSASI